jgi:hypothetical protein
MYPYMTLADNIEVVHSHLKEENDLKVISVHFERPKPYGFDSARISLPSYEWLMRDGFSDDEIKSFEEFTARHAHTLFHYAEIGGLDIAKAV